MKHLFSGSGWLAGALLVLIAGLGACAKQEPPTEKSFVGKWHSSKAAAPIRMDENGEWELLNKDGTAMQYGVWQLADNKLMWSVRVEDDRTIHDLNAIVSVSAKEFRLRERDGSVTTFSKLD